MNQTIRLVADDREGQRLGEELLQHWPSPRHHPRFAETSPDALAALLQPDAQAHEPGIALIATSRADRASLMKLVNLLGEACWAALVLVDRDEAEAGHASPGVIVSDRDASPSVLAAALHALASQHLRVTELTRELRILQKTSGGVQEEISRMSQELSLAQKIQQELIPRELPRAEGLELGVLFRPAGYVSGDIYNIAQVDNRHIAFFIADAVGHGVPAALLTMIISRSLPMRGGVSEGRIITPADALGRLNDELCEVSDGNPRFATAVYGLIDTETGLVRISNAGHPQPMRIGPEGVQHIDAGGPLLGVFHEAEFTEEVFELHRGETLLLYSDGFETAFPNADALLRVDTASPSRRYLEHLLHIGRWRQRGARSVRDAFDRLAEELDAAQGSLHQPDDVTALALARLSEPAAH
ncbi:MAG: PP2C family protein-serine/threonine phosphatase [Phycisphaerales bacterium]